jgi:uncharacterized membrane protein
MTRSEFIAKLKSGLRGLPAGEKADIIADYEAHFDAAAEEGRPEEEVSAALGDPARLARELRLEAGVRQWREGRTPSSAFAAIVAFMGLATLDILILLPILISVLAIVLALYVAIIAVLIAGGFVLVVGPFNAFPGGALAAILVGIGLMAGAVAAGALLTIATIGLINAMIWFGRLHYRVIEPAIQSDNA